MINDHNSNALAAAASDVDDAVGVPERHWFVAVLKNRSEKATAQKLSGMGVECYLPMQEEVHVWKNGKKAKVERVLIPSKIFIHCTEKERRELVTLPFIFRFMTDIAGRASRRLAVVPAKEIERLKFMLGASDGRVTFTEQFVKGQKIEVIRGPFRGLQGVVLQDANAGVSRLYVNIDMLGSASVEINPNDIT